MLATHHPPAFAQHQDHSLIVVKQQLLKGAVGDEHVVRAGNVFREVILSVDDVDRVGELIVSDTCAWTASLFSARCFRTGIATVVRRYPHCLKLAAECRAPIGLAAFSKLAIPRRDLD
ncbi:hypothetical protein [Rhizobium sp. RAF56]|uniref:hypothetical protein n=1 Tax=Rhizobium sp. RAF56 TaxID=3233062 RepID=UPI003F9629EA